MTRTQIIAAAVAGIVGPFAFALFINALYQMCLGMGWDVAAAGAFAMSVTVVGWGCAIAVTVVTLDRE